MGRAPCCDKLGLKKGPWTPEEDQKLIAYIQQHGHGSWRALPKNAGLLRCGKSCRLRWTNYLRPDIKRGRFSLEEEQSIIQLHAILGNKWSAICTHLPGRTDNEIKNYWNTHLKKKLLQMGIDPVTHKPKLEFFDSFPAKPVLSSTLSHMAQWENARLQAEARLAREYMKFGRCKQISGSGIQAADGGGAWKGDLRESIRKDLSASECMEQCCSTDSRKMLHEWERSLQSHEDLSFSLLGNEMVMPLPFDLSHSLIFSDGLGLKGVPQMEQILSPSSCSLDSMDSHSIGMKADASLQCESLLQQSEKLLKSKALFRKERAADAFQNPINNSCSSSLQLPPELLLDLESLQQQAKSAFAAAAISDQVDLSSLSDQTISMQSKDYWCNLLKLVGSPVLG